jgi:hypothetical protein
MIADLRADSAKWKQAQELGIAPADRVREARLMEDGDAGSGHYSHPVGSPLRPGLSILKLTSHERQHSSAGPPSHAEYPNHFGPPSNYITPSTNNQHVPWQHARLVFPRRENESHSNAQQPGTTADRLSNQHVPSQQARLVFPRREDESLSNPGHPGTTADRLSTRLTNPPERFSSMDRLSDTKHDSDEIHVDTLGFLESNSNAVRDLEDTMNFTDSGYGTQHGSSKMDEHSVTEDDTDSVATDESQVPIPGQDKYLLEVAFACEILKKFSPLMQEQFALHDTLATELLYNFSVMVGKRASSVAQRGAASFVRRGRK